MTGTDRLAGAGRRARGVVLSVLVVNAVGGLAVVGWLTVEELRGVRLVLAGVVLVLHTVAHALLVRSAVTPWVGERARDGAAAAVVVATLLAWPLLGSATSDAEPWAWLAGYTLAALLVTRPVLAAGAAVLVVVLLAAGSAWWGGQLGSGLLYVAIAASASGGLVLLVVWMLRLVVAAEDGRAAEAGLAVSQERLRVSRDLHDVLGHRLTVIALRAELAGDAETERLARSTLQDVRATVHEYGRLDLDEQLSGARLVLGSAGIDTELVDDGRRPSDAASQLLAAAVREAVTNILRHSRAGRCGIEVSTTGRLTRLAVVNDGVGQDGVVRCPSGSATGLAGLGDRAAVVGGEVRAREGDGLFRLEVEVPT